QDGEAFKETVDAAQDVEAPKDLSNPTDAAQDVEASKDLSNPNDAALTESFSSSSESKASTEKEGTPDLVADSEPEKNQDKDVSGNDDE
ncbi:hypothetical protein A2U01_0082571, partial [Trifolium medium]|nr:hypothetical protein [Trifolium medium]